MPSVLAIAAHPDDIEFVMAGTMLLLRQRGWELHYFNLADGRCGSEQWGPDETAAIRAEEARAAATALGAVWYPPIGRDLELAYDTESLQRVAAVVRQVQPAIVLTHSPVDYMVDHEVACRLAVTATFARGMRNFSSLPPREPSSGEVAVYHAQPHGNRAPLRELVHPELYVDVEPVLDRKLELLGLHQSQQGWLEVSQGMSSYQESMREQMRQVGSLSGRYRFAEGWRRHLELGFSRPDFDPLRQALADSSF
jgi:LmbE family N-acetylglucosaminyl deacetylase